MFYRLAQLQGKHRDEVVEEWHSLVQGFSSGFCPWPPRYEPNDFLRKEIEREHHYFMFGRVLGFTVLAAFLTALLRSFV